MRIGYVGLGALGGAMAKRLLNRHEVVVWDANGAAIRRLHDQGAQAAESATALAEACDLIFLCLPRSSDVHQAFFAADGLAPGLRPGTIVIDQTSGIPSETRAMAEALAKRSVSMMDAAVSASPQIVAQGAARLMAAGPAEVLDRADPVLRDITEAVYRCGHRVGDGQAMKMINNAMNAACRLGTLEVVALGRKAGLPLATITDTLNAGEGANQTTERMLPAIARGQSSTDFALSLMLKDVNQAMALGMETGVPMPVTAAVRALLQIGANGLGELARLEDMIGVIASMAGTAFVGSDDGSDAAQVGDATEATSPLLDRAVAAQCRLATVECVAAGLRYGLALDVMNHVLNASSGWSAASRQLLPALLAGQPSSDCTLGQVIEDLRRIAQLGVRHGTPLTIAMTARAVYEAAVGALSPNARADALFRMVADRQDVPLGTARTLSLQSARM